MMSRISLGISLSIVATVIACGGIASYFLPVSGVWAVTDQAAMVLHFYQGRVRVFWITSDREEIVARRSPVGGPDLWVEKRLGNGTRTGGAAGTAGSPRGRRVAAMRVEQSIDGAGGSRTSWDADGAGGSRTSWDAPADGREALAQESTAGDRDADVSRAATSARPWWGRRPGGGQRWQPPPHFLFQIAIGSRNAVPAFGGQWRKGAVIPASVAGRVEVSFVRMPVWLPVVVLLLQPVRAILRGPWLWRRRERRNQCQACGYERLGLPEPRCPECGTPHGVRDGGGTGANG